jgi:hypothetical protein
VTEYLHFRDRFCQSVFKFFLVVGRLLPFEVNSNKILYLFLFFLSLQNSYFY